MLISGRIWRDGAMWLAESEIVDVCAQGRSKKDAIAMLADAFETLIDDSKVEIAVEEVDDKGGVMIDSNRPAVLAAFGLQRLRLRSGRSLSQVAESMGRASKNAYARYEQGDAIPTIESSRSCCTPSRATPRSSSARAKEPSKYLCGAASRRAA